jgi:hypothetical protein
MNAHDLEAVVATAPRARLDELAALVWKSYAADRIGEDQAQALAEAIARRKAAPAPRARPPGRGSRPRAPESIARRRQWAASGWMPPNLAARFTPAESAALAVVASECARAGACVLPIGAIAGRAGCSATTVRNALRQAAALGLVSVRQRRRSAWRSDPNVVSIVSPEWRAWQRLRRPRGGCKFVKGTSNQEIRGGEADRDNRPVNRDRSRKPLDPEENIS